MTASDESVPAVETTNIDQLRRHRPALRSRALSIVVDDRGIESALRSFKRLILKEGLLKELKRHAYFEKPGDRKRRKIRESVRRKRRQASRLRERYGVQA